jgi:ribosomal protein L29
VEAQIARKQGKTDQRSVSLQALLREQAELKTQMEAQSSVNPAEVFPEE